MLSYFNIRNLYNADIVRARKKHWKTALDGFRWFRTNVVSQLADRLKIRTNGITSEPAEVRVAAQPQREPAVMRLREKLIFPSPLAGHFLSSSSPR